MNSIPNHEQIQRIMDGVYNKFYLKWRKQLTQDNKDAMMQEARELDQKYPYELCHANLLSLIECIEEEYRRRNLSE